MSIEVDDSTRLPRPLSLDVDAADFKEWQIERVEERGGDVEALKRGITIVRNALDRVLGTR